MLYIVVILLYLNEIFGYKFYDEDCGYLNRIEFPVVKLETEFKISTETSEVTPLSYSKSCNFINDKFIFVEEGGSDHLLLLNFQGFSSNFLSDQELHSKYDPGIFNFWSTHKSYYDEYLKPVAESLDHLFFSTASYYTVHSDGHYVTWSYNKKGNHRILVYNLDTHSYILDNPDNPIWTGPSIGIELFEPQVFGNFLLYGEYKQATFSSIMYLYNFVVQSSVPIYSLSHNKNSFYPQIQPYFENPPLYFSYPDPKKSPESYILFCMTNNDLEMIDGIVNISKPKVIKIVDEEEEKRMDIEIFLLRLPDMIISYLSPSQYNYREYTVLENVMLGSSFIYFLLKKENVNEYVINVYDLYLKKFDVFREFKTKVVFINVSLNNLLYYYYDGTDISYSFLSVGTSLIYTMECQLNNIIPSIKIFVIF